MRPIVRPIFTNSADTSAQHEDANNFTLLRLLLAVMVVFGHFKLLTGSPQPFPFNLADAAVDCFFVVSGFLVTGSFERSRNLWAFYTRRVFRVWPMYAFVVVAQTVALVALLPRGIFSEIGETLRYLVANLLMANFLQNDIGGVLHKLVVPTINPSLWTLKIEMGFYLIIPAIYLAIRRWGWSVLVIIFATSALYDVVALKFGFDRYAKQLPGQMQFFVVGMALYLYGQRIRVSPIVAVSVSVAFLAAWTWFWPIPSGLSPLLVGAFVFCFAFCLPVIPVRIDPSYSIYLQHGPAIQILLLVGILRDRFWMLLAVLVSVLVLSCLTECLVEKPGIELGKRISRRSFRVRVPEAAGNQKMGA